MTPQIEQWVEHYYPSFAQTIPGQFDSNTVYDLKDLRTSINRTGDVHTWSGKEKSEGERTDGCVASRDHGLLPLAFAFASVAAAALSILFFYTAEK